MTPSATLDSRRSAAAKYCPRHVRLLLVAEAPPCTLDRYFYFEHVDQHDWLFRYVWEGLTGKKPDRNHKADCLDTFKKAGVFLIDLHEESIASPTLSNLKPEVPGLVGRAAALKPDYIILIKSSVYDATFEALRSAKLPVIDARLPFPASGQQRKFLDGFREAVSGIAPPIELGV